MGALSIGMGPPAVGDRFPEFRQQLRRGNAPRGSRVQRKRRHQGLRILTAGTAAGRVHVRYVRCRCRTEQEERHF